MAAQNPELLGLTLQRIPTENNRTRAEFRRAVVNSIWNQQLTQEQYLDASAQYDAYFTLLYEELCRSACSGLTASSLSDKNNQDLLDTVSALRDTTRPP